jgi:hypothetical protein
MFNLFKWFNEPALTLTTTVNTITELVPGGTNEHEFGESVDGTATIRQMKNGKFRLLVNGNEVIGTYSRKRDAIRGADRKGLIVVEEGFGGF